MSERGCGIRVAIDVQVGAESSTAAQADGRFSATPSGPAKALAPAQLALNPSMPTTATGLARPRSVGKDFGAHAEGDSVFKSNGHSGARRPCLRASREPCAEN